MLPCTNQHRSSRRRSPGLSERRAASIPTARYAYSETCTPGCSNMMTQGVFLLFLAVDSQHTPLSSSLAVGFQHRSRPHTRRRLRWYGSIDIVNKTVTLLPQPAYPQPQAMGFGSLPQAPGQPSYPAYPQPQAYAQQGFPSLPSQPQGGFPPLPATAQAPQQGFPSLPANPQGAFPPQQQGFPSLPANPQGAYPPQSFPQLPSQPGASYNPSMYPPPFAPN